LWLAVTRIIRFNMLAYALLVALVALTSGAVDLLGQPSAYFHVNGVVVVLCGLAFLVAPVFAWSGAARRV
jgi:hypothetical protein